MIHVSFLTIHPFKVYDSMASSHRVVPPPPSQNVFHPPEEPCAPCTHSPSPAAGTANLLSPWIRLFWTFHTNRIVCGNHSAAFGVCPQGSSTPQCVSARRSFLGLRNISLYVLFICPLANGYLSRFHVLAIMTNAAMNIHTQVFFTVVKYS